MSDTEERARFDAWWLGDYGSSGPRAWWPSSQTEAAWMAWKAQAEEIQRLRNELHISTEWSAKVYAGHAEDMAEIERLREALRGVIRVADRKTVEFDAAHAALNSKGETE
jgi:hypothetical protein